MPVVMRVANLPVVRYLLTAIPPNARALRGMLRGIGVRHALEAGRVTPEWVDWYVALLRDTPTMRNEIRAGRRIISP